MKVNVHNNIIQDSPNLETIQVANNWWIKKQNMLYLCNSILLSNAKEWVTGMNLKNIMKETDAKAIYSIIPRI